jgi:hypothetical protein
MPKDSKEREAPVNSMVVADINSDGVNEIIVRVRVALAALHLSCAIICACAQDLSPYLLLSLRLLPVVVSPVCSAGAVFAVPQWFVLQKRCVFCFRCRCT